MKGILFKECKCCSFRCRVQDMKEGFCEDCYNYHNK